MRAYVYNSGWKLVVLRCVQLSNYRARNVKWNIANWERDCCIWEFSARLVKSYELNKAHPFWANVHKSLSKPHLPTPFKDAQAATPAASLWSSNVRVLALHRTKQRKTGATQQCVLIKKVMYFLWLKQRDHSEYVLTSLYWAFKLDGKVVAISRQGHISRESSPYQHVVIAKLSWVLPPNIYSLANHIAVHEIRNLLQDCFRWEV